MSSLPDEVLLGIFKLLPDPQDVVRAGKTCRQWQRSASDEAVWAGLMDSWAFDHHHMTAVSTVPDGPLTMDRPKTTVKLPQNPVSSRLAFARHFARLEGWHDSVRNMKPLFCRLIKWLERHSEATLDTLQAPRPRMLESFIKVDSHPNLKAFQALFTMCNGQALTPSAAGFPLFGHYFAYGQDSSLVLLPEESLFLMRAESLLTFAFSADSQKTLALVVGQIPDCPKGLLLHHVVEMSSNLYVDHGLFFDFFTRWVTNLESGMHDVTIPGTISMFPNRGFYSSLTVTRGIHIHASTVPALEYVSSDNDEGRADPAPHVYRIKMELGKESPMASVQLISRRWNIQYASGRMQRVQGLGVIGESPILTRDNPRFSYSSFCAGQWIPDEESPTTMREDPCTMFWGDFQFVPGTQENPLGGVFDVEVDMFGFRHVKSLPLYDEAT